MEEPTPQISNSVSPGGDGGFAFLKPTEGLPGSHFENCWAWGFPSPRWWVSTAVAAKNTDGLTQSASVF